jgi:hypothetical protein
MQEFMTNNLQVLGNMIVLDQFYNTKEAGIMDMIGLDVDEKRVSIMELKNVVVDERVIPQVLRYVLWARENPEYFRNKIVQRKDKELKDIVRDEDDVNYDPRIVLIAPSFSSQLLKQSQLLDVDISFVEISRYKSGNDLFVTVDYKKVEEIGTRLPTTRQSWSWEKYKADLEINDTIISIGQNLERQLDTLILEKGWDLRKSFGKGFVAYKSGWRNVFLIQPGYWISKDCWLEFKLGREPRKEEVSQSVVGLKTKWSSDYHSWYVRVTEREIGSAVKDLQVILERAHTFVTLGGTEI